MRLFTCVYGGTFQKHRVFTAGGRHATEGNLERQDRILYHMEVRTLYARRMFREKLVVLPYISHMLFLIDIFDILPFWELA